MASTAVAHDEELAVLDREPPEVPEDDAQLLREATEASSTSPAVPQATDAEGYSDDRLKKRSSTADVYGIPDSPLRLAATCPPGPGGLIWHAEIVSDDWFSKADCFEDGKIKPRRAILPVRASNFFSSLVQTEDSRWIFSGVLNAWPGLNCLELRSITVKKAGLISASIVRLWDAENNSDGKQPAFPDDGTTAVHATLRMAPWSARGWAPDSPGCVWWYFGQIPSPSFSYGENILNAAKAEAMSSSAGAMPQAKRIHLFAHRYARGEGHKETTKEGITWHSLILLEWDHGLYTTVVELATLNGIGGRRGKSNWYHDKNENYTALYKAMPPEMIVPWKGHFAEVRCTDVAATNSDEFMAYLKQYEGPALRFLEPTHQYANDVRVSYRSKADIARYLLNYMGRDRRYTEQARNCQSFAADLFSFMAGKKDIQPFHQANRVMYTNRSHLFLYEPDMFSQPAVEDK